MFGQGSSLINYRAKTGSIGTFDPTKERAQSFALRDLS
jgi:hypothetical protein